MSKAKKNGKAPAQPQWELLAEWLNDGQIELVAEHYYPDQPFSLKAIGENLSAIEQARAAKIDLMAQAESMDVSKEQSQHLKEMARRIPIPGRSCDEYLSLYVHNPTLLASESMRRELEKFTARKPIEVQPKDNVAAIVKYRVKGDIFNQLVDGVKIEKKKLLKLSEDSQGQLWLNKEAELAISRDALGTGRPFRLDYDPQQFQIGLAKAAPFHGLSNVLLVRGRNAQALPRSILETPSSYNLLDNPERFSIAVDPKSGELTAALYISPALATSIQTCHGRDVVEFAYGKPDGLTEDALSSAFDGMPEKYHQDILSYMDNKSDLDTIAQLAARYWPKQQTPAAASPHGVTDKATTTAENSALPALLPPKKISKLLKELHVPNQIFTPYRRRKSNGDYNYGIMINQERLKDHNVRLAEIARESHRDFTPLTAAEIWQIADERRCTTPLPLQGHSDDKRTLSLSGDVEDDAYYRLYNHIPARYYQQEDQVNPDTIETHSFRLQSHGLRPLEHLQAEIIHLRYAQAPTAPGEAPSGYLYLSLNSALKLADNGLDQLRYSYLSRLGLRSADWEWITQQHSDNPDYLYERPLVLRVKVAAEVFADIISQFAEDDRRMRDYHPKDEPDILKAQNRDELDALVRKQARVKWKEVTRKPEKEKPAPRVSHGAPVTEQPEQERDTVALAAQTLSKVKTHQLVLAHISEATGEEEVSETLRYLILRGPKRGNKTVPFDKIIQQLKALRLMVAEPVELESREDFTTMLLPVDDRLYERVRDGDKDFRELADEENPLPMDGIRQALSKHFTSVKETEEEKILSPMERLGRRSLSAITLRYPSAERWQALHRAITQLAAPLAIWADVPQMERELLQEAKVTATHFTAIGMGAPAQSLQRAFNEIGQSSKSIAGHLKHAQEVLANQQERHDWMEQHLDDKRMVSALLLADVSPSFRKEVLEPLEKSGAFTRQPESINYDKITRRHGKRVKFGKAQALVLYPTSACRESLASIYAEQHEGASLPDCTVPERFEDWMQAARRDTPVSPDKSATLIDMAVLQTFIHERFDARLQVEREKDSNAAGRVLHALNYVMSNGMKTQLLLVNERQENPLSTPELASKETQGEGVPDELRGSQPVLICHIADARDIGPFLRKVYKPLKESGLLRGQKRYAALPYRESVAPGSVERAQVDLQAAHDDLRAFVFASDTPRELAMSPSLKRMIVNNEGQLDYYFTQLQRVDEEGQALFVAGIPADMPLLAELAPEHIARYSPQQLLAKALQEEGIDRSSPAGDTEPMLKRYEAAWNKVRGAFSRLNDSLLDIEEKTARFAVIPNKKVVTAEQGAPLQDIDGNTLQEGSIQPPCIIKCYLQDRLDTDLTKQIGKMQRDTVSRLPDRPDTRQLRKALSNRSATAQQLASTVPSYFSLLRGQDSLRQAG